MKRLNQAAALAVIGALGAAGFSGCETMNEHRTATGAVVGTLAGAGAGAMLDSHNRGRGAAIGAVAGAALGGGVGYMLQKQKQAFDRIKDLESQERTVIIQQAPPADGPQTAPVQVERKALTLRLQNDVLFGVGSSALSGPGASKVAEIAQVLKEYPDSDVIIRGYTSSEGGDKLNSELSQRRADVIKAQLVSNAINPARIQSFGMGSSNPVGDNNTEAGRMMNRRVEIDVIPRGE